MSTDRAGVGGSQPCINDQTRTRIEAVSLTRGVDSVQGVEKRGRRYLSRLLIWLGGAREGRG